MSERSTDQTAILAVVPTSVAPHILELIEGITTPQDTVEAIELPATRNAAAKVVGRLIGDDDRGLLVSSRTISYGDIVTPLPDRPTSLINLVSSGETVEAITIDNLRDVSRNIRGLPHLGGHLAGALGMARYGRHGYVPSDFMVNYQPKRTPLRAIRANQAGNLSVYLENPPEQLFITDAQRGLLAKVCKLIEASPDQTE